MMSKVDYIAITLVFWGLADIFDICSARPVPLILSLTGEREWILPASTAVDSKISRLYVKDYNDPTSLVYSINAEKAEYADFFVVDRNTGVVTLKRKLDLQKYPKFEVSPSVYDGFFSSRVQVPVQVIPDNVTDWSVPRTDAGMRWPFMGPKRQHDPPPVTPAFVFSSSPALPDVTTSDFNSTRPSTSTSLHIAKKPTSEKVLDEYEDGNGTEAIHPANALLVPIGERERERIHGEKREERQSGESKKLLPLLSLLGIPVLGGFLAWGLCRSTTKKYHSKEKLSVTKSVSVETSQTICKDDQFKLKPDFSDPFTKTPLHPVLSQGRYFSRKRSSNFAGTPILTGPDGYLHPKILDEDWEVPRDSIRILELLGEGCFGQVFRAEIALPSGGSEVAAVKRLKENATENEKRDLQTEIEVMKTLDHPNVVQLHGCCTDQDPLLVIMEYVALGKLLTFLRKSRNSHYYGNLSGDNTHVLTPHDLTSFAYQVARGMQYLSLKGILHRDLAARNILIDQHHSGDSHDRWVCKVSDFGLARDLMDSYIYERKSDGKLPLRWMAPESLKLNIFTTKSDVWSFGILFWEIVTLGSTPYAGVAGQDLVHLICDLGEKPKQPAHCKRELYHIMCYCWEKNPNERDSFDDLVRRLEELLHRDQDYLDLNNFPDNTYSNEILLDVPGERV